MAQLNVKTPEGTYPILIGSGLLARGGSLQDEYGMNGRAVVVTNTTVRDLYAQKLAETLDAPVIAVPDGEVYKTLDTVRAIYDGLIAAGIDRNGVMLAVGGGVLGDMAGFAAATYLRGIRLIQIPTTLLAMVDSSVGGKVGVDMPQGKNLIGAFKQPERVLIDPDVLHTLPAREIRCGLAEIIKHGFIADAGLLTDIEMRADTLSSSNDQTFTAVMLEGDFMTRLIARAMQVKIDIVQDDPYEQGIRAHLNLGHTFAHAIETVSSYAWLHGEAVGIGLLAAARLSHALGMCDTAVPQRVENLLQRLGMPHRLNDLDPETIYAAMGTDKKRQAGKLRFVLLEGLEKPVLRDDVPKEMVIDVLKSMKV